MKNIAKFKDLIVLTLGAAGWYLIYKSILPEINQTFSPSDRQLFAQILATAGIGTIFISGYVLNTMKKLIIPNV